MSSLPTYTGATRPSSPSAGDAIYLSDVNRLAVYDGDISEWRTFNSDGLIYNAAAPNELHYSGGIYDNSSATYYISNAPTYHLDASLINGADAGGNPADQGSISTWVDRVGSISAAQTTASKQAKFVALDSSVGNKPGVSFDGTDEYGLSSTISNASYTYIIVTQSSNVNYSVGLAGASYAHSYWFKYTNGNDYVAGAGRGNLTTQAQLDAPNIYVVKQSGTQVDFRINGGAALWSGTSSSTKSITKLGYNALNRHLGVIYEIIVCDQAQSNSDLNTTLSYLGNKYGITTATVS